MPSITTTPIPYGGGATQVIFAGAGWFKGVSLRETAGAAAIVRLWDNPTTNTGTLIGTYAFVANQSYNELYTGDPVYCAKGLFLEKVSGTIEGSIRIG